MTINKSNEPKPASDPQGPVHGHVMRQCPICAAHDNGPRMDCEVCNGDGEIVCNRFQKGDFVTLIKNHLPVKYYDEYGSIQALGHGNKLRITSVFRDGDMFTYGVSFLNQREEHEFFKDYQLQFFDA